MGLESLMVEVGAEGGRGDSGRREVGAEGGRELSWERGERFPRLSSILPSSCLA